MLVQIRSHNDASLPFIQQLYDSAFPRHERRDWAQVVLLLQQVAMELLLIRDGEQQVGFVIRWQLGPAQYIEHFAVDPLLRGRQYGSRVVQQLLAASPGQLILEVEPPTDEASLRRIGFYEKQGFMLSPFSYYQPPYRRQEPPVPMRLMSVPAILHEAEMDLVARTISQTVYEPFQG